jgi:hypothetical protein
MEPADRLDQKRKHFDHPVGCWGRGSRRAMRPSWSPAYAGMVPDTLPTASLVLDAYPAKEGARQTEDARTPASYSSPRIANSGSETNGRDPARGSWRRATGDGRR